MSTEAQAQPRPKPLPPKKRYCILLSHELAERFERVARLRHGAKSAIVEEALDRRLNPEKYPPAPSAETTPVDPKPNGHSASPPQTENADG